MLVDGTLPLMSPTGTSLAAGKFKSLAVWAGHAPDEYFATYYQELPDGGLARRTLYHPAYFRSMLVRLYLFAGRGVSDERQVAVVSFESRGDGRERRKFITGWQTFERFADAELWIADRRDPARHRIVSDDPLRSCAPLEPLEHYRRVHGSPTPVAARSDGPISMVEVYEYLPARGQ